MSLDDIATSQKTYALIQSQRRRQGSPCAVGGRGKAPNFPSFRRTGLTWVLEGATFLLYIPGVCSLAEQLRPWEAQHPVARLP